MVRRRGQVTIGADWFFADFVGAELGSHVMWALEVVIYSIWICLLMIERTPYRNISLFVVLVGHLLLKDYVGEFFQSRCTNRRVFGASQHLDVLLQAEPRILLLGSAGSSLG